MSKHTYMLTELVTDLILFVVVEINGRVYGCAFISKLGFCGLIIY